jgi:hypothetical protein
VKVNSESYSEAKNSKQTSFTSEIREYAPPDNSYTIFERKTDKGVIREEQISVGQKKYIKQMDGSWREIPFENRVVGGSAIAAESIENEQNIEYFYKGKKNISNQMADLYEEKTTRKYKNLNLETVLIKRYWFDQNGMFLKNETESKVNNKVNYLMILEYEYDPNIKIVAPKIN